MAFFAASFADRLSDANERRHSTTEEPQSHEYKQYKGWKSSVG
jgi:hypothetical protein